jgi:PST family polysaccharide transporter
MKYFGRATIVGMLWSWIASFGTELMWLPTAMITARLLSPEDFGITATATFFLQLATRLTQFGFNAALVKMKNIDDEHANSVFVMNIVMGAVAWLALTLSAPFAALFFHSPATGRILPVAALSFLVVPLGTVPNALLVRNLQYRELTYCLWIGTLSSSVSTISLAWAGFGFWSLVYGQLITAVVQAFAKAYYAGWIPRLKFHASAARDTFSFGLGIYALRLLEYGSLNLDSMTVGRTMGMATLGFYDKAFNLMSRVLDRLNQGGPAISFRVFAVIQDEPSRFRRGYRKVIMTTALVGYPAMTLLGLTAVPLFEVMFGKKWVPSALPFEILCIAGGLKVLNGYAESVVEAAGLVWSEVWRQVIYVVLIVAGVAVLSPWGTPGAAAAVLIATVVMTLLMHHLLITRTRLTVGDIMRPQVPGLLCTGGLAAAVWSARAVIDYGAPGTSSLVRLVVLGLVGGCFYVTYVLLTPSSSVRELREDVLHEVWPELRARLGWSHQVSPAKSAEEPNSAY